MGIIRGLAVLLLAQASGELFVRWLGLPVPGPVIGMVLLLVCLHLGVVPVRWVEEVADGLIGLMALLFVPAGVGLMVYFEVLSREWVAIVVATAVSTILVLTVTSACALALLRHDASSLVTAKHHSGDDAGGENNS